MLSTIVLQCSTPEGRRAASQVPDPLITVLANRARDAMLGIPGLKAASYITNNCCYPSSVSTPESGPTAPRPSDQQPLILLGNTRKRKNSGSAEHATSSTSSCLSSTSMKRTCGGDTSGSRSVGTVPNISDHRRNLCLPFRRPPPTRVVLNEDSSPLLHENMPSPATKNQQQLIEKWLAQCPEPGTLRSPDEVVQSEVLGSKFVMVQVFTKESLVKSDLIALPAEGHSTEICICHVGGKQQPRSNATTFRLFQFQIFPENPNYCEQFIRQFGDGIRIFCSEDMKFSLHKSTSLLTYYGSRASLDWTEIRDSTSWQPVFHFSDSGARRRHSAALRHSSSAPEISSSLSSEFNTRTVCSDNVVRLSVGCKPHRQIYQTQFHIKLSFVAR